MHPPSLDYLSRPSAADIDRPVDVHGNTYLHALCRSSAPPHVVAQILRTLHPDVNKVNSSGYSPLRYAIEHGQAETVALLLQHGARPVYDAGRGKTYNAVVASVHRARTEIVEAVLKNGGAPHVNEPGLEPNGDMGKIPPLNLAVQKYQYQMIAMLAAAGADLHRVTPGNGFTPLMQAVNNDAASAIATLVRAGADINARAPAGAAHAGMAPLHLAAQSDTRNTVTDTLLQLGADIEQRDERGRTPLMIAIEAGNRRTTECLLKAGANPDARNPKADGETALMIAARKGNHDGAEMLLAHKADPLLADAFNRTAAKISEENRSASRSYYDPMLGHSAPQPLTLLVEAERKAIAQHFDKQYSAHQRKRNGGDYKP